MSDVLETERLVIGRAIDVVLAAGNAISVNDGEEWVLRRSRDKGAILAAMFSTDEDIWMVRDANGKRLGAVQFIHGNGADVIADYAMRLDELLTPVFAYAETL